MRANGIELKKWISIETILDEALITNYIESNSDSSKWNETQLSIITESITNAVNTIVHCYGHYPGNAVYLLKLLQENNRGKEGETIEKNVIKRYIYSLGEVENMPELFQIQEIASMLLRMGAKTLRFLRLELRLHTLQEKAHITEEQLKEVHQILDDFVGRAISLLENSAYYAQAKQERHLYYPEPPIVIDGKRMNPPSIELEAESSGKKRKKSAPEEPSPALDSSFEGTFFHPNKKVKKQKLDQTMSASHHIAQQR